jgi:hypothetical protein
LKWSEEELLVLDKMAGAGKTIFEILRVINRSKASIENQAHARGKSLAGKSNPINREAYEELMGEAVDL